MATIVRLLPDSLDRIRDAGLRAAAVRYEAETGTRLADRFKLPADEGVLGVFLLMHGYSLTDDSGSPSAGTPERD